MSAEPLGGKKMRSSNLWILIAFAVLLGPGRRAVAEQVYSVGPGIVPPHKISSCDPVIPEELKHVHIIQPRFVYDVVISSAGKVVRLKLVSASQKGYPYDDIERAFRSALRRCAFYPATKDGKPVAVRYNLVATVEVR